MTIKCNIDMYQDMLPTALNWPISRSVFAQKLMIDRNLRPSSIKSTEQSTISNPLDRKEEGHPHCRHRHKGYTDQRACVVVDDVVPWVSIAVVELAFDLHLHVAVAVQCSVVCSLELITIWHTSGDWSTGDFGNFLLNWSISIRWGRHSRLAKQVDRTNHNLLVGKKNLARIIFF